MYPPDLTAAAQRDAQYHLQLRILEVAIDANTAIVSGEVARVFRGPKEMIGQKVTTSLPCIRPGEVGSPTGDSPYPIGQIREGRILEAYFCDSDRGLSVQAGLSMLADGVSEVPRIKATNWQQPRSWRGAQIVIGIVCATLIVFAFLSASRLAP